MFYSVMTRTRESSTHLLSKCSILLRHVQLTMSMYIFGVERTIQGIPSLHEHVIFKSTRSLLPHSQFLFITLTHQFTATYSSHCIHFTSIQFLHIFPRFLVYINISTQLHHQVNSPQNNHTYHDRSSKLPFSPDTWRDYDISSG